MGITKTLEEALTECKNQYHLIAHGHGRSIHRTLFFVPENICIIMSCGQGQTACSNNMDGYSGFKGVSCRSTRTCQKSVYTAGQPVNDIYINFDPFYKLNNAIHVRGIIWEQEYETIKQKQNNLTGNPKPDYNYEDFLYFTYPFNDLMPLATQERIYPNSPNRENNKYPHTTLLAITTKCVELMRAHNIPGITIEINACRVGETFDDIKNDLSLESGPGAGSESELSRQKSAAQVPVVPGAHYLHCMSIPLNENYKHIIRTLYNIENITHYSNHLNYNRGTWLQSDSDLVPGNNQHFIYEEIINNAKIELNQYIEFWTNRINYILAIISEYVRQKNDIAYEYKAKQEEYNQDNEVYMHNLKVKFHDLSNSINLLNMEIPVAQRLIQIATEKLSQLTQSEPQTTQYFDPNQEQNKEVLEGFDYSDLVDDQELFPPESFYKFNNIKSKRRSKPTKRRSKRQSKRRSKRRSKPTKRRSKRQSKRRSKRR